MTVPSVQASGDPRVGPSRFLAIWLPSLRWLANLLGGAVARRIVRLFVSLPNPAPREPSRPKSVVRSQVVHTPECTAWLYPSPAWEVARRRKAEHSGAAGSSDEQRTNCAWGVP